MSESTEVAVVSAAAPATVELGVVHGSRPTELLERASEAATALASLIKSRHLASNIQGKEYVRCEGWTTLGAMLGVTPHEISVTEQDGVFTAIVELRRITDGAPIARASAECGAPDEVDRKGKPVWSARPRYARRSMALTRATAKAGRLAFSWIMVLAGYAATPAEEMAFASVTGVSEDGEIVLPGSPQKWGGFGGQPLAKVPDNVLSRCREWHQEKGRAPELVEAIDEELESRRDGAGSDAAGASQRTEATLMAAPAPSLDELPAALREDDEIDALCESVERALRDTSIPESQRALVRARWTSEVVPTKALAESCLKSLENTRRRAEGQI